MQMLKVLIGQKRYVLNNKGEVTKLDEYQTFNYKGHELPKLGGVVKDQIYQTIGYVFDESKYDENMNRRKEFMVPYDWTNPFVSIDQETINIYEIKEQEEELALVV